MQAQGDFSLNAGQHSVTYLPSSDTAATGRYQVLLYDNNFGAAESYPKFDWGQLGAAVVTDYSKGTHSFGRIFTVDETARTYKLVDQIAVPFSGYVSGAQRVGDSNSMLVASGQAKTFTEYDLRMDFHRHPRWKPRSTSTACTSTSCSAALCITSRQIPRGRVQAR
ncbi:MAG: aryl-sulfate sulfotransferase [Collinsella sp.]